MSRLLLIAFLLTSLLLLACSEDDSPQNGGTGDGCGAPASVMVGSKPWAVASDARTERLYSADEFDNTITVLDLCTYELVVTLKSGTGPNSISIDRGSGTVFVANFNSNDVTVIQNDAVVNTIPVGQAPWSVFADDEEDVAYVANSESGSVMVLSADEPVPLETIDGLAGPRGLALAGRTLYVAEASANRVRAIDLDTHEFSGEVTVGQRPQGMAIDTSRNELWVTSLDDATVSVVDLETFTVVATVPVGVSPLRVTVDPDRSRAYTADSFGDSITVIDTQTHEVAATYRGVQRPWDVHLSEDGLLVYVANSATSEIIALDPAELEAGD